MPTVWKPTKLNKFSIRLDQAWPNHVHINAAKDGEPPESGRAFAIAGADDRGFYRSPGVTPEQAAGLGMLLDDNGCIALRRDDPAMVKIRELEAEITKLKHERGIVQKALADAGVSEDVAPKAAIEFLSARWTQAMADLGTAFGRITELEAVANGFKAATTSAQCHWRPSSDWPDNSANWP